jgi:hypothetical protein
VDDAVRQPSQDVENRVLVSGKDVGQVCAIQNILERREDANPNVRAVLV